jgi:hypothetical protein
MGTCIDYFHGARDQRYIRVQIYKLANRNDSVPMYFQKLSVTSECSGAFNALATFMRSLRMYGGGGLCVVCIQGNGTKKFLPIVNNYVMP